MAMFSLLLLPALVFQAPEAASPALIEVARGVYVLKGVPTPATYVEMKQRHITRVIDLRQDGESPAGALNENVELQAIGAEYVRYAITRTPPAGDFAFLRELLRSQPHSARVVIHCSNGNRAAAAVGPWLVLDKGMAVAEAKRICREAGLQNPETERAMDAYLQSQTKS